MHFSLFSAALQHRLTAGLCKCNYTRGDLVFIQVCSEPTEMQCSTALGKMHFSLFSAAQQHRLTAGLCHCIYTYGDLVFIQLCSKTTEMQCSTGLAKMHCSLFKATLQHRLTAGLTQHRALQHCSWQNAPLSDQCCCATQIASGPVTLQIHL